FFAGRFSSKADVTRELCASVAFCKIYDCGLKSTDLRPPNLSSNPIAPIASLGLFYLNCL
ncbi:MAG: hypothetical protein II968_05945, partial [Selenomonadaceae bacterium]|nr:hypothetical protein [Selenomonadaceae bacterium]